MTIKVLVIDDSALMRAILTEVINQAPDLTVVGSAPDPLIAREMIKRLEPDVLTLDIEMPRMDGLDFLERLMRLHPLPVLMISSLTAHGSESTLRALALGAVDYIPKPKANPADGLTLYAAEICEKIRVAASAKVAMRHASTPGPHSAQPMQFANGKHIFIGASTGGTEAIRAVLEAMPENSPPILMVQHMPAAFTGSFAKRLDGLSRVRVKEAENGERVAPGTAYLAPGYAHLSLRRSQQGLVCELSESDPVNRHRPAVDVLFHSAASLVGAHGVGVLLTGMGKDGAQGLLAMHKQGAWTVAQDEASCVVYGMPREAALIGAADEIVPLGAIASRILQKLRVGA